jgi:hypothetical protein
VRGRRNIEQLPLADIMYRVDARTERGDGKIGFETRQEARIEDGKRARSLRTLAKTKSGKEAKQVRRQAKQLKRASLGGKPPRTMMSRVYMRKMRLRFASAAWKLVEQEMAQRPQPFTIIPKGWTVPAAELGDFDPEKRLAALRMAINRAGGFGADGWLMLFLDCEFDPVGMNYRFHVHGLACGGLLEAVRKLRKAKAFRSDKDVYKRVRIEAALYNLPDPLTYMLKGFWSARWEGEEPKKPGKLGKPGKRRATGRMRIPEPYHAQHLLWLDEYRLADINLLMRLDVGPDGFNIMDSVQQ